MSIVDDVKKATGEFPAATGDPEELARLQEFLLQMKEAGVAKTREYDLPRPDTIGRALVDTRRTQ